MQKMQRIRTHSNYTRHTLPCMQRGQKDLLYLQRPWTNLYSCYSRNFRNAGNEQCLCVVFGKRKSNMLDML